MRVFSTRPETDFQGALKALVLLIKRCGAPLNRRMAGYTEWFTVSRWTLNSFVYCRRFDLFRVLVLCVYHMGLVSWIGLRLDSITAHRRDGFLFLLHRYSADYPGGAVAMASMRLK